MDYKGQTSQQGTNQPFFTEGVGNQYVEYTDSPENDINLSNSTSWENTGTAPTRNQNQSFGKNAINGQPIERPATANFETFVPAPETGPDFGPTPEMLKVTDTEPAPASVTKEESKVRDYDVAGMIIEGNSLNPKAVAAMMNNEKKLKKTRDASRFVNEFNDMSETTVNQSFKNQGNS